MSKPEERETVENGGKQSRPLYPSDADFYKVQEFIRGNREKLAKQKVRASWSGVGIAALKAVAEGRVKITDLKP